MNKKTTFKERFKYFFDSTLSHGPIALIAWLAAITLVIVAIGTALFVGFGVTVDGEKLSLAETIWQSLMRTIDSGVLPGDTGWHFRAIALLISIGGIIIASTLIGILTSGIEEKIADLRKGRSQVLESDHIIILGWSEKVFAIIEQLMIANESRRRAKIVVLADKDKVEMEDEIRTRIKKSKVTKVICRSGSPLDFNDLAIVGLNTARSIIVLAPEDNDADIYTIKSVLAITNNPDRKKEKYHIVAEITDEKNMEAANLVGGDEASYILTSDLVGRAIVQSTRQPGLSVVYTDLLSFEGSEIYFAKEPTLVVKTFNDAMFHYSDSMVVGLASADGKTTLNPAKDLVIKEDDSLIFIAEDDSTIKVGASKFDQINSELITEKKSVKAPIEKTLILGWNKKGGIIIEKADDYLMTGSKVTVVSNHPDTENDLVEIRKNIKNQEVELINGDITEGKTLGSLYIINYDHIIILSYNNLGFSEAEAQTLICLLHLRSIGEKAGKHLSIVSEILSEKNKRLAEVSKADDFIISEKLTSLVVTQLSENKVIKSVYDELFDAEGSEIYMNSASDYVKVDSEINFFTVTESASKKNEVAIGYRILAEKEDPKKNYGVHLNPNKDSVVKFGEEDKIIVMAV